MKWKSHVAIAKQLAREFDLSTELERALCSGSVEPDKRPDRAYKRDKNGRLFIGRAPHHQPPTGTIMAYIWRSRKAYLQGNDYYALKSLGRALHYVQDKSVSVGFLGWSHDSREERIGELKVPLEAIRRGIDSSVPSPLFIRECINAVRPEKDPYGAMYQAAMYSAAIFASVIGSAELDDRYVEEYEAARRRHFYAFVPAAVALGAASSLLAYVYWDPLILIPGAIVGFALVRSDLRYYHIREEAEWFGL